MFVVLFGFMVFMIFVLVRLMFFIYSSSSSSHLYSEMTHQDQKWHSMTVLNKYCFHGY